MLSNFSRAHPNRRGVVEPNLEIETGRGARRCSLRDSRWCQVANSPLEIRLFTAEAEVDDGLNGVKSVLAVPLAL